MKSLCFLLLMISVSSFANSCLFDQENPQNMSCAEESTWLSSGVEKKQTKTQTKKILVFVSFSMPEIGLREWIKAAHKHNASVVVRGLKNNSFKDTAMAIAKLLGDDKKGGIEVNPQAFKDFNITRVPAVVVVDRKKHYVVYGNVSLEYALGAIAKHKVLSAF